MSIKYRLTQSKRRSNQAKWKHLCGWSIRERGGFKITCIFCHIKHFVNVGALFVFWWIPDPTLNELWMIVWLSQIKSKFFILFWELQNKAIVALVVLQFIPLLGLCTFWVPLWVIVCTLRIFLFLFYKANS